MAHKVHLDIVGLDYTFSELYFGNILVLLFLGAFCEKFLTLNSFSSSPTSRLD